jgi:hypothetical protein
LVLKFCQLIEQHRIIQIGKLLGRIADVVSNPQLPTRSKRNFKIFLISPEKATAGFILFALLARWTPKLDPTPLRLPNGARERVPVFSRDSPLRFPCSTIASGASSKRVGSPRTRSRLRIWPPNSASRASASACRFRKLHPPEWRLFPNQNMIPFDDRNCLSFRSYGVRLLQVATAA